MASPKIELQSLIDQTGGWDWEDKHVTNAFSTPSGPQYNTHGIGISDIIESGTVLIAAGPADLDKASENIDDANGAGGFRVVPIGLVETAQISLNKPLSRIFEIGSKLSYIIPGRTVGGISLSRVFFDGPSILKALYYGEVKMDAATANKKYAKFMSDPNGEADAYRKLANIGSGDLAMNLASSFFDQPMGLAFFFKNHQFNTVGETYFEGCRISTYNLGISAGMNVLTESVNIEFTRVRPILTSDSRSTEIGKDISDLNIVSNSVNWSTEIGNDEG